MKTPTTLSLVAVLPMIASTFAFVQTKPSLISTRLAAEQDKSPADINPVAKASWYAVETFGKLFAPSDKNTQQSEVDQTKSPSSPAETLRRIKDDNDRSYFLSGEVDSLIYDEECVFSDPFVAFSGRDRFVDNLSNLGSFITDYDAKMLDYTVSDDGLTVDTKVMVKLELNLPWMPVLAWPWGVKYSIDKDTYLVTDHVESWDVAPLDGVKQIFRKPTTKIKSKRQ